jgi:hypothetical protein
VKTVKTETAALRTHLANRRASTGLAGAVLIGDLPYARFERNGQFGNPNDYQAFACDLYYMDLNGSWSDADSNGILDTHAGNVVPEIWVGRLTASPLVGLQSGRTEAGLLNSYFQKDHQYRTKQRTLPKNGLAYIDDDWIPWASTWGGNLASSVWGTTTIVSDGATTTAADYKSRLQTEQLESLLLAAHSWSGGHSFKIGADWTGGSMANSEIQGLDPKVFFYNLFACSNSDYTASGYMGGEYVFGTTNGLLAVGATKTGGMLDFGWYYSPLGQGKTFGDAFQAWWLAEGQSGSYADWQKDWFYGMTLIGDPTLLTQAFIPEPATLALLALGLAGMVGLRSRRAARARRAA